MQLGIFSFNTEYTMPADELARECEVRGFESLWLPEHTHIPANRESQYPGGGELPKEYVHMSDPFIGLAAAAAVASILLCARAGSALACCCSCCWCSSRSMSSSSW